MRGCLFNHEVTMKVINFAKQNTVVNQYVAELRDVNIQKDQIGRAHV